MENNKNMSTDQRSGEEGENQPDQILPVHNPLKPDDPKQITQEDIDNEQKYKEALTERD